MDANDRDVINRYGRRAFRDDLRYGHTRQGAFEARCLHLEHPLPGGGRLLEPSDHGAGAARIHAAVPDPPPLWRRLWNIEVGILPPTGLRILRALEADWRTTGAARIAHFSRPTVDMWKKIFKVRFAQCFRAYKRSFGPN